MKLFYIDKLDKAKLLTAEMIVDGWTKDELIEYWTILGYDQFFINTIVSPFFIN